MVTSRAGRFEVRADYSATLMMPSRHSLAQGARSCRYLVERPSYELIDNEAVSLAPYLKALPPFERNVKLLDDLAGFFLEKFNYDVILFSRKPACRRHRPCCRTARSGRAIGGQACFLVFHVRIRFLTPRLRIAAVLMLFAPSIRPSGIPVTFRGRSLWPL